jgi:hypothetical protein
MDQKPFRKAAELKPDLILLDIGLPKSKWNRSRPVDTTTLSQLQDNLPKPER